MESLELNNKILISKWNPNDYCKENQVFKIPQVKFKGYRASENKHSMSLVDEIESWRSRWQLDKKIAENGWRFAVVSFTDSDKQQLEWLIKIFEWLFITDDQLLEPLGYVSECKGINGMSIDDYIENSFTRDGKHDRYSTILWEILNEMLEHGCLEDSLNEMLEEYKKWMHSIIKKTKTLNSETTFEDYYHFRELDSSSIQAIYTYMATTRVEPLSMEIVNSKLMKDFIYSYAISNYLVNDLYSFNKEIPDSSLSNYIKILTLNNNSIEKSINIVINIINEHFERMMVIHDQLLSQYKNNNSLKEFVHGIVKITVGNLKFCQTTPRYSVHLEE
ncbi:terpenoid synthase domain-containing protein [Heterostelium album PN500]|uniref:Terpenoid synthase domain-containing protein n=1 Tax=Heterostelium pallidum (strain ATCC 26659 / Pp 5 / PN500) TaxID=670386 RepID=D3BCW7_HETP5|nr:terpenoid synthase domain-containing protein [Heterostelium album PN500]EFA80759.1 terpenoid synthase domain-containing protein [Heterostelium album PN500]|eukprot:XP_020432878.1 terpenoid synthase domain-containing protein [Heterostelium album PN500]